MKMSWKKTWVHAAACPRVLLSGAGTTMLLIVGCATFAPGDDPKGQGYKAPASKVLVALDAYKNDRGRYPNSLYELVPKYLEKVPDEPSLRFDEYTATLRFAYSREWPQLGRIVCVAHVGTTEWNCEDYH